MAKKSIVVHFAKFLRHVVPAAIRPARTLWHELIAFLFIVLALFPIPSAIRLARSFDGDTGSIVRLAVTGIFVVIMGGYGISSFLRARKISRS